MKLTILEKNKVQYVDWKILNEYANEYKEQIMKEIYILRPDIIVCCGTYWTFVDNICGLYKENGKAKWKTHDKRDFVLEATMETENGDKFECLIFNMYHPSARMKTENYIERFKQLWEAYKCNENVGEDTPILKKEYINKVIEELNENSDQYFDLCELISSIPQDKKL